MNGGRLYGIMDGGMRKGRRCRLSFWCGDARAEPDAPRILLSSRGNPMGIKYEPLKCSAPAARKRRDEVVGEVGNLEETKGMVRNDAAKRMEHLLGQKAAKMFGDTLEDLRANPQQFSVVFKDKGLRLNAIKAIGEKARVTDFPNTEAEVYDEFSQYMEYCETFFIPPSLGMFAVWCGTSLADFEKKKEACKLRRPEVAQALGVCKELIRDFVETKAMDGDVAPAVYLHQNKAYFEAVETTAVRHETTVDQHVRDPEQIGEIIDLIPDEVRRKVAKGQG